MTINDVGGSTVSANFAVAVNPMAPVITTLVGQPVTGSAIEVKGTGEAGDTVTLFADSGATPVGNGMVASDGSFDITTSVAFVYGLHTLTATETDAAGLTSTTSAGFPVTVDPTAPPPPTNLVVNGSFETDDFSGWTLSGNVQTIAAGPQAYITSQAEAGQFAAGLGPVGSDGIMSQADPDDAR